MKQSILNRALTEMYPSLEYQLRDRYLPVCTTCSDTGSVENPPFGWGACKECDGDANTMMVGDALVTYKDGVWTFESEDGGAHAGTYREAHQLFVENVFPTSTASGSSNS